MTKSIRKLKVPQESALRNLLRHEIHQLSNQLKLLPPVPFTVLEQLAIDLLKKLNISDEYIDFSIVLLGNESWRKTVESTPYNRRLLLLPQCLKDNNECKGVFDELGLNCAACKACPIDDILLEAESLGYTTLVAEGTTVAIGLLEEGSIDAVIGVSCMPVLQRSFDPVSNAAVPVIGLPLMHDGCENTKIDLTWLYEEFTAYKLDEKTQPISNSTIKYTIQEYFKDDSLNIYFDVNNDTQKLAKEYLQIGGQRLRPILAALAYTAYSNTSNKEILLPLSIIIECFHKASLVHDDIEDNSELRYNQPTAHKKHGIAQAINTGDYLIGRGYQILSTLPINSQIMGKALKRISDSHVNLALGQGADIGFNQGQHKYGIEDTLQIFRLKTGEAIKVALMLGAILADAADQELQILNDFSDFFGIAYQIRDDIDEFNAEEDHEKIADFPFLVALLIDGNVNIEDVEIAEFRKIVVELAINKKATDILSKYIQMCYKELDKLNNAKLRLSLYGVLGKVFKTSHDAS